MNRRQAIRQITVVGTTLALFPGCNLEEIPQFDKIPLERKSWNLLKHLSEAILPVDYEAYPAPEPRAHFILKMLNNTTPSKLLDDVLQGFTDFQNYLSENKQNRLDKMEEDELNQLFEHLESDQVNEPLASFYGQVKGLAKLHFTTSERYMKEELDYRYLPGKYQGNVDVNTKIQ